MRNYFIVFGIILLVFLATIGFRHKDEKKLILPKITNAETSVVSNPLIQEDEKKEDEIVNLSSVTNALVDKTKAMKLPEGQIKLPVLMYHHVREINSSMTKTAQELSVTPANFDKQMGYLRDNNFTSIPIDQMMDALEKNTKLSAKPIIITFDDGYRDFYTDAFPILKKYNIRATVFVVSDYFDAPAYVTKSMIKEMAENGIIDFESHGHTHTYLDRTSKTKLDFELTESKKRIKEITGKEVKHIAFPYGAWNNETLTEAAKIGYRSGFTIYQAYIHFKKYPLLQDRIRVNLSNNLSVFAKKVEIY